MRWSRKALLGLGVLGLAAAATPARQERDDGDELVVVGTRDGGIEVEKLLAIAAEVTGEPFFYEPAALHGLRAQPIGRTSIPRRDLLSFLEGQFRENDLDSFDATVAGTRVHAVVSRFSLQRQTALKTQAEVVATDELAALAERGKLITTTFTFQSIGLAAGFDHTLCYRFSDSATESIRMIQGTGSYILTGAASNVASVVALMKRLDAAGIPNDFDEKEATYVASLEHRITALESALAGR